MHVYLKNTLNRLEEKLITSIHWSFKRGNLKNITDKTGTSLTNKNEKRNEKHLFPISLLSNKDSRLTPKVFLWFEIIWTWISKVESQTSYLSSLNLVSFIYNRSNKIYWWRKIPAKYCSHVNIMTRLNVSSTLKSVRDSTGHGKCIWEFDLKNLTGSTSFFLEMIF